jgi:hypothetical protein
MIFGRRSRGAVAFDTIVVIADVRVEGSRPQDTRKFGMDRSHVGGQAKHEIKVTAPRERSGGNRQRTHEPRPKPTPRDRCPLRRHGFRRRHGGSVIEDHVKEQNIKTKMNRSRKSQGARSSSEFHGIYTRLKNQTGILSFTQRRKLLPHITMIVNVKLPNTRCRPLVHSSNNSIIISIISIIESLPQFRRLSNHHGFLYEFQYR